MKILLQLVILVSITSCNTNTANNSNTYKDSIVTTDTTTTVPPKNKYLDSFIKTQQQIAYGNIKFGMSKKDYDKLPHKETQLFQTVGTHEYEFNAFTNHENKIYKLQFKGFDYDANFISTTIHDEVDNLISVISKKYGDGEFVHSFPDISGFNAGFITFMENWYVGTKHIQVGAGENKDDTFYSVCWITDMGLENEEDVYNSAKNSDKQDTDASKF